MNQNTDLEIQKIEELAKLKGKTVLEIGCGEARISKLLVPKVKKLVAIDPDKKCIAKNKKEIKGIDFQVGKGEALKFKDKSFDIVVFTFSLHHHQNFEKALAEAYRVLKDNGQALAIEPATDGEVEQYFNIFDDETDRLIAVENAVKKSGFKISKKEIFTEIWTFDDAEDLYSYLFKFHKQKAEEKIIQRINALLKQKINLKPIFMKDKIVIFSLKK